MASNFIWTETFYSLQGEGIRAGVPSIFIRMFGCNFTCQGFGMPLGEVSNEYQKVKVVLGQKLKDLPIVKTGCDSYAAWDKRFAHLSKRGSANDLLQEVINISNLPDDWDTLETIDIVFTGGEPMLPAQQKKYKEIINLLVEYGVKNITFETNGTQTLDSEFKKYIESLKGECHFIWSISPKLRGSGEPFDVAINRDAVGSLTCCENSEAFLKFVIGSNDDFCSLDKALTKYEVAGIFDKKEVPILLMPTGGTPKDYAKNSKWLAAECIDMGYRFSPRLHVDLFGNKWGT